MRQETKDKMDAIAVQMQALIDEFRADPQTDAQFCKQLLGSSIATMDMRLGEMYGLKLDYRRK